MDRAALDVALRLGIDCGGWCPRGRLAEDGVIPERYPMAETDSPAYAVRTRRNVQDSDATLILNRGPLDGGTALTAEVAHILAKPCLVVDVDDPPEPDSVSQWLQRHHVHIVNVAGPRESSRPGIYSRALEALDAILRHAG